MKEIRKYQKVRPRARVAGCANDFERMRNANSKRRGFSSRRRCLVWPLLRQENSPPVFSVRLACPWYSAQRLLQAWCFAHQPIATHPACLCFISASEATGRLPHEDVPPCSVRFWAACTSSALRSSPQRNCPGAGFVPFCSRCCAAAPLRSCPRTPPACSFLLVPREASLEFALLLS